MTDRKFPTAEEVSERYRGEVRIGTLRNWRAMRVGPAFVKIGKAVLNPVDQLDAWDEKNLVACRASRARLHYADYGGRAGLSVMITWQHDLPISVAALG